jgi:flagellar L-ring protein precursor FlgH
MKADVMKRTVITLLVLFMLPSVSERIDAADKFSMVQSLDDYIRAARANQPPLQTTQGSLYSDMGIDSDLFSDLKARRINDIVTIRIQENTQAQSAADAQTNRKSSVALQTPNLFGIENNNTTIAGGKLVTANTDMQFKGDGSTNRSGSVEAFLSARVREVLPNGDMVIEGVKEVKVNNERQMLRLFGVVRPRDVRPDNVVFSTAIANMLVQVDGKGILSDNLKPGWLFNILTKVWPF